jgi:hypothetical protein
MLPPLLEEAVKLPFDEPLSERQGLRGAFPLRREPYTGCVIELHHRGCAQDRGANVIYDTGFQTCRTAVGIILHCNNRHVFACML